MFVGSLAAFLTTVVFLIDVILVAVVRKRIRDATDNDLDLVWGNAVRPLLLQGYATFSDMSGYVFFRSG
jgi:hypothetical protein